MNDSKDDFMYETLSLQELFTILNSQRLKISRIDYFVSFDFKSLIFQLYDRIFNEITIDKDKLEEALDIIFYRIGEDQWYDYRLTPMRMRDLSFRELIYYLANYLYPDNIEEFYPDNTRLFLHHNISMVGLIWLIYQHLFDEKRMF